MLTGDLPRAAGARWRLAVWAPPLAIPDEVPTSSSVFRIVRALKPCFGSRPSVSLKSVESKSGFQLHAVGTMQQLSADLGLATPAGMHTYTLAPARRANLTSCFRWLCTMLHLRSAMQKARTSCGAPVSEQLSPSVAQRPRPLTRCVAPSAHTFLSASLCSAALHGGSTYW